MIIGEVSGFDRVRMPRTDWGASRTFRPLAVTGLGGGSSVFDLQKTFTAAPGSFLPQNIETRVPAGWATNPLRQRRPAGYPGNGGTGP